MKAIVAGAIIVALGYGWIAFESRWPFVFQMLDTYEEHVGNIKKTEMIEEQLRRREISKQRIKELEAKRKAAEN